MIYLHMKFQKPGPTGSFIIIILNTDFTELPYFYFTFYKRMTLTFCCCICILPEYFIQILFMYYVLVYKVQQGTCSVTLFCCIRCSKEFAKAAYFSGPYTKWC